MHLNQPVRNVMQKDVASVCIDASIGEVREVVSRRAFHHVPVITDDGVLVGIVSTRDLARFSLDAWVSDALTAEAWLAERTVDEVMTPVPQTLRPDDSLKHAAAVLGDGQFHALPVVDHDRRLVGILTSTDLIRYLYAVL